MKESYTRVFSFWPGWSLSLDTWLPNTHFCITWMHLEHRGMDLRMDLNFPCKQQSLGRHSNNSVSVSIASHSLPPISSKTDNLQFVSKKRGVPGHGSTTDGSLSPPSQLPALFSLSCGQTPFLPPHLVVAASTWWASVTSKLTVLHGHPWESSQNSRGDGWSVFLGSFRLCVKLSFLYLLHVCWVRTCILPLLFFWFSYLKINQNQMLTFKCSVSSASGE